MPEAPDWPLHGQKMAWGVPGRLSATAVPVDRSDLERGLTKRQYRDALALRVAWMLEREPHPRAGTTRLAAALEQAEAWNGPRRFESPWDAAQSLIADNLMWPEHQQLANPLPHGEPFMVRQMPAAVRAMLDTDLDEWISLAVPDWRSLE